MAKPKVSEMRKRLIEVALKATEKAGKRGIEVPKPEPAQDPDIPEDFTKLVECVAEAWDLNCTKQREVLAELGRTIEKRLDGENLDDWDCLLVQEKNDDYSSRFEGNDLKGHIPQFTVLETNDPEGVNDSCGNDRDLFMTLEEIGYDESGSLLDCDGDIQLDEVINDTTFVAATSEQVESFIKSLPRDVLEKFWYLY